MTEADDDELDLKACRLHQHARNDFCNDCAFALKVFHAWEELVARAAPLAWVHHGEDWKTASDHAHQWEIDAEKLLKGTATAFPMARTAQTGGPRR